MFRRVLCLLPAVVMFSAAAPAVADQANTITATGTGTAKVVTGKPFSDSSIKAAVERATKAAAKLAIADARGYALVYAGAAGLKLGSIVSISDLQNGGGGFAYYGPGPYFGGGPFGPNQFCQVVPARAFKHIKRDPSARIVDRKHRRVCFVPPAASDTLTVTYSAS